MILEPESDMTVIPINQTSIDVSGYWKISAVGVEGAYIVSQIMQALKDVPEAEQPIIVATDSEGTLFLINKKHYSATKLATITGRTEAQLEKMAKLKLSAKDRPDLPEATVPGWGTA